jgi:hypothetical protein
VKFIPRRQAARLRRLLRLFPVVLIHGPRQCGKSTLVRHVLPTWLHVDLERPADLALITADLEGFLTAHPRHLVIDEAQRLPALFPVLRHVVDRSSGRGRFVLLGSASPGLLATASETLAGRIGLLELTPFLASELARTPLARDRWFWGGYPPVFGLREANARTEWLDAYVSTFLERELPLLGVRLPATRLRTLWTMLTHVHGHLLNVSDLARSLAVSSHTVNDHLDVLEATFMVRRLRPYHANIQKRLTKAAKVYIRDSGLLHLLAGLRRPSDLDVWARRGHSFEGLVVEELAALASERMARPDVFFWRTQAGAEVDLLIVDGARVLPIEVKLGTAVGAREVAGLRQCMKDLSLKRGWVIYTGRERRRLGREIELVPWVDVIEGETPF